MTQVKLCKPRPFRIDRVPVPTNGIDFVYPPQPLDVEIGCGAGLHPIQYAKAHPDRYLVAIEQTRGKFEKFQRRFANHHLPNLLPVHANAISWVSHGRRDHTVDNFFFLYSNPNPKNNDLNNRWYAMPCMAKIIACLRLHRCIHLATNTEFYAVEAKANFEQVWHLETLQFEQMQAGEIVPRTHFEKKYLIRGQTCFDLVFKQVVAPQRIRVSSARG